MTNAYAEMQVNPFEDAIVREPREVSFSVKGLNDAPLNRLLARSRRAGRGRTAS
ncbi:hypothetical protein ACRAVF_14505 [Bradyrhizobium oligotrophicum S58]